MKLRRCEMYKQVSAEKKEALLLQRRTNRQALKFFTVSEVGEFPVQTQRAGHLDGRCSASDNPLLMDFPTISVIAAHLDCRCSTSVNPLPIAICTISGTTGDFTKLSPSIFFSRGTSGQLRSSWCKPGLPKQTALSIRERTPLPETAVHPQLRVTTPCHNPEKGKDICSPFVIHKTGSTSGTSSSASLKPVQMDFATLSATTGSTSGASNSECHVASKIIQNKAHKQ